MLVVRRRDHRESALQHRSHPLLLHRLWRSAIAPLWLFPCRFLFCNISSGSIGFSFFFHLVLESTAHGDQRLGQSSAQGRSQLRRVRRQRALLFVVVSISAVTRLTLLPPLLLPCLFALAPLATSRRRGLLSRPKRRGQQAERLASQKRRARAVRVGGRQGCEVGQVRHQSRQGERLVLGKRFVEHPRTRRRGQRATRSAARPAT
mmetsp:Transcript_48760/g.83266  ORF Transcript_48760/g.83266 Transcript_48760/m.83266 type:complete len:205 (-) Transcript_48760:2073-2687(-)